MRVCIFHYHLNPGGVTRIIESQIDSLLHSPMVKKICLITGHAEKNDFLENKEVELIVDPVFSYLTETTHTEGKYNFINKRLREICHKNDILHFHNLNLGKNPLITLAASNLAVEGYKVLNHAHDFAEDRPDNFKFLEEVFSKLTHKKTSDILYPNTDNYRFAVLNSFDFDRLKTYGVKTDKCSLLPNPVVFNESKHRFDKKAARKEIVEELDFQDEKLMITYPVRVIRRKNIGEFILLSILFREKANWIVTQPPKNPVEIEYYNKWKEFCLEENIKINWEAGNRVDFEKLIRVSDFCITTSIQEGFGMVYMEPWLFETPVTGRNIAMVTTDIKTSGIEFPLLYDHFYVKENQELYTMNVNDQQQLIRDYAHKIGPPDDLVKLNPWLNNLLKLPSQTLINRNKKVILTEYSLEKYRNRLDDIYRGFFKESN